jgi:hypothetical protein
MKKVKFNLDPQSDPRIILPPEPAHKFVPDWYRKGERFINKEDGGLDIPDESYRSGGLKSCNPFLDSIIAGYIQATSCAIDITKNDGEGPIEYRYVELNENDEYIEVENLNIISERQGSIGHTVPRPHGHSKNHMVWSGHWGWETPRGYSMLVTHPMNQFQLPYTTASGFMESDRFTAGGNIPWYIKEGWIGVIPKGSPMYQIIPVKRDKWFGYVGKKFISKKSLFMGQQARNVPYGFYRDKLWVKKNYEME